MSARDAAELQSVPPSEMLIGAVPGLQAPRRSVRLAWVLWGIQAVLCAVALTFLVMHGFQVIPGMTNGGIEVLFLAGTLAIATVGALIASRRPDNAVGWIFSAMATGLSLFLATLHYVIYINVVGEAASATTAILAWFASAVAPSTVFLGTALLFLLFPNGRLLSHRWRPVAWLAAVGTLMTTVAVGLAPGPMVFGFPIVANPFGIPAAAQVLSSLEAVGLALALLGVGAAALSLLLRFRRAAGVERQQLKWFVSAGALFAVVLVVTESIEAVIGRITLVGDVAIGVSFFALPVAAGMAILKHRLYDIDVVINKTVLVGVLAAFITLVYLVVVVGVGALVGARGQPNLLLAVAATALVAVAFQPVRERAQRLADRLVYGERVSPYEAMADFSQRVAGALSLEDLLPRMAETAARGVGATSSQVSVLLPPGGEHVSIWPDGAGLPREGFDRIVAVMHQGEEVGEIAVAKPPGEPVTAAEEKLLGDLASQAGVALRNVRLTLELQARLAEISQQARELRASRQRLVAAQDGERRRLERDLHDGAQQQIVALKIKLAVAKTLAQGEKAGKTAGLLDQLAQETEDAVQTMRELAHGIYPPLLAAEGLAAAVNAAARRAPIPVEVRAEELGRYPQEIEAAVYFCCVEALQNATKYAHATQVRVELSEADGALRFRVVDDGDGFDPAATPKGAGLTNLEDRIYALGGEFQLETALGQGTVLAGRIPLPAGLAGTHA